MAMTPRTVARIAGVDVRVDRSWFVIAALITWSFWTKLDSIVTAVVAAALFFASLLAHELAHALEARHRGIGVRFITLYLIGGATETETEATRPGDEFAVTAVGPWTSLVLGCAFGLVAFGADRVGPSASDVGEVAALLAWVNLLLGFFNLLPGAPLDGGRILDSIVWRVTGDRARARRISTAAGRFLGYALIVLGFAFAVLVSGGVFDGVWLALIGWILSRAATAEGNRAQVRARTAPEPEPESEPEPEP
ncbi:MAG: site-2 protease family protein [Acidimicrobiales bacterium]|nr:site-2 protease family protein [Acidimicrobiales bacterium]